MQQGQLSSKDVQTEQLAERCAELEKCEQVWSCSHSLGHHIGAICQAHVCTAREGFRCWAQLHYVRVTSCLQPWSDSIPQRLSNACFEGCVLQDLKHEVAQLESRCKQLEGQLAEAKNDVAADQMLFEIDKLAAAKQQAEQRAQQAEDQAKVKEDRKTTTVTGNLFETHRHAACPAQSTCARQHSWGTHDAMDVTDSKAVTMTCICLYATGT